VGAIDAAEATTIADRATALRQLAAWLKAHTDPIAAWATLETGCPSRQSPALQVGAAVGLLDAMATLTERHVFAEDRVGLRSGRVRVLKRPVGVAVGIVPWNVPLFMMAMKLGAAIAAGAPIVLKGSPETAHTNAFMAEAVAGLDLPRGMISLLTADRDIGASLVADPRVAKVSFTGSTAAGKAVAAACADRLVRCTLELGGKSAAILLDDVDFDRVAPELFLAMLQNNGQVCGAQSRVLIPRARWTELSARLAALFDALAVGDPRDGATDIGPVASVAQQHRVQQAIARARWDGASLLSRDDRHLPDSGCYVPPMLFATEDAALSIVRDEVFGPVVVAMPYDDEAHAVRLANDSPYGLSGSVWSAQPERAIAVGSRLRTGTVGLSTKRILDFGAPFGGHRLSGLGRELGPEGIDAYLETISLLMPEATH
jgi:acyl-CoA reductase-like NAD-dependent aldehyde dehydrogenase